MTGKMIGALEEIIMWLVSEWHYTDTFPPPAQARAASG
jgi:hypothetical protein